MYLLPPHSGLTPPTTPPHKSVEDELFKPADGGRGGGGVGGSSGGSESVHLASNSSIATKGSFWAGRAHPQRKLPEQTELYAQLRRTGQAGDADARRGFGDHDYCLLSLGESRKRSAAILGAMLQGRRGSDGGGAAAHKGDQVPEAGREDEERPPSAEAAEQQEHAPPSDCQSAAATPPTSEEEAECSAASRSPSPIPHLCPDSPSSKTDSR